MEKEYKSCSECKHFNYQPPYIEQPHPELWCDKGHWHGITCKEDHDALIQQIECVDFIRNKSQLT